jgi:hypothetical protein
LGDIFLVSSSCVIVVSPEGKRCSPFVLPKLRYCTTKRDLQNDSVLDHRVAHFHRYKYSSWNLSPIDVTGSDGNLLYTPLDCLTLFPFSVPRSK